MTRVTTGQCDFNVVVDQSGQDNEDYQGVLGCTELYCTVLGTSGAACCCEVKIPNQYGGVILWCLFMYRIGLKDGHFWQK